MQSKNIIYPVVIGLLLVLPVVRYYIGTPGVNDCMTHYIQQMPYSEYKGYIYDIDGFAHIEPANTPNAEELAEYQTGEAYGCLMSSGHLYNDFVNSVYCSVTYMIQNAPVVDSLKTPLALYDGAGTEL